jgi:hypothetical protein
MLKSTFCHLPGVGAATEEKLWKAGIVEWSDIIEGRSAPVSVKKLMAMQKGCADSLRHLENGDVEWFGKNLPAAVQWRMFPYFMDKAAYIDIETTGTNSDYSEITTIALWTGNEIKTYINGRNLDDFAADIAEFPLLVSFNGKCFDIPFIEKFFGIRINAAHIDLRFVFRALGITGGLKGIEKHFGINRGDAEGLDGFFAVLLWNEYEKYADEKALETLLAYNVMDSVNLENLMVRAYNLHIKGPCCRELDPLEQRAVPENPYKAHRDVVDKILSRHNGGF